MTCPEKDGKDNRDIVVRLRVNMTEKQKLEVLSVEAGLSLSDWIRHKAIDVAPLLRKPGPDRKVLLQLLFELGKIGSNVNQIARHMNRKREDFTLPMQVIVQTLEILKATAAQIRNTLEHGQ